ncbi:Shikimate kinase I [Sesbania bispinosa]|nr:Shikimate kinase I [Sesbania bispinosa]
MESCKSIPIVVYNETTPPHHMKIMKVTNIDIEFQNIIRRTPPSKGDQQC